MRAALVDLEQRLGRYAAADAREADFRARMIALLAQREPLARTSFTPGHFTASAFLLAPERDAILLVLHKKLGIWVQPGGHVEASDATLLDAAEREVREEVGQTELAALDAEGALFDLDVHAIPARPDEPAHEHFDVRFAFVCSTRRIVASDEVSSAEWVPLTTLHTRATDESVRRAGRKLGARP